ncbi:MAG: hypothetical protein IJQ07_05130 [Clostridia bacterium]|nr:hypothetical protein [Clostridia bacterium]
MSMFIFKEARHFQKKVDKSDLYIVKLNELVEKDGKQFVFDRDYFVDKESFDKISAKNLTFGAQVEPVGKPAEYFGGKERLADLKVLSKSPYEKV